MKPNLRNADVKSSRHGSLSPKDGTQTPTKIQPKRRAKSAIKDYSLLLLNKPSINYSRNRTKVVDDGTPSKIIASQLQKMGLEEEDDTDENMVPEKTSRKRCAARRSLARTYNGRFLKSSDPLNKTSPELMELDSKPHTKPATPLKVINKSITNVHPKPSTRNSNKQQLHRKNQVVLDGEEVNITRPIIRLRVLKQSDGNNLKEYQIVKGKDEISASCPHRKPMKAVHESSDEEYQEGGTETDEDESSESDELSEPEWDSPSKRRRSTKSTRAQDTRSSSKVLFHSPSKWNTQTAAKTPRKHQSDGLEAVRLSLHTSEMPEHLPCREEEFEKIYSFIRQSIQEDALSRSMYISGVPGTGKTATVIQVIRYMKRLKGCPQFSFIMVNGMEIADPKQIFTEIYVQLFGSKKKIAASTARRKLNDMFQYSDSKRKPIVIVIDELDLLCTKRQEIIYDIFNWSSNEESGVSVLAIANTLDLPERILSRRVGSRLGLNRLCFQPYDHDQIAFIIRNRLSGSSAVQEDALEFASRKVASVSGDLRKALDILRRATQLAINYKAKQLTMKHVQDAVKEASTTASVDLVHSLSRHSLMILRSALAEQISCGLDEFLFSDLLKQYRLQCHVQHIDPLPVSSVYGNAMEMCTMRLLAAAPGPNNFTRRFRLGMTAYEMKFALKNLDESIL